MFKKINIFSFAKICLLVFMTCFFLAACAPEDKTSKDKTPLGDISGDATPQSLAAEQTDCWQSALLKEIYEQSGKLSISLYGQITGGALTLMLTGFAVWMSFRLLKHLGSFQEESIPETWSEIFKQLLLCTVCGLIAGSSTNVMWVLNHVIFPLYYAFLEFGAAILNTAVAGSEEQTSFFFMGQETSFSQNIQCAAGELSIDDNMVAFPEAPQQLMSCLACAINERLGLASSQILTVLMDRGVMAMFIGLLLYVVMWFVKIAFVFYLVDNLFRFTVMIALLPICIMAYAFKFSRSLSASCVIIIVNSAAYMMMIAFVIATCLLALQNFISLPALGLNGEDPDAYETTFKEFSIALLCLLMMVFVIASTMKIVAELTGQLVGGNGSEEFQKQAGKFTAWLGKGLVMLLSAGIGALLMKVGFIAKTVNKAKDVKNKAIDKLNSLAGRGQQE